jgi:peptide/nickel transport system permease protein
MNTREKVSNAWAMLWRRDRLSAIGLVLLASLVLLGLFGPYLPLGDATKIAAGPRLTPPSWRFPFGTDELGRSFLPRVILGIRATFLLSASAVLITSCVGAVLGMTAGYLRGTTD